MIRNKNDLKSYLAEDFRELRAKKQSLFKKLLFPNKILEFQIVLRKAEYYHNTKDSVFLNRILFFYYKILLRRRSLKLGFSIPINVFGPGLSIAHYGTIVVNPAAKIGANCRIHVCVNIGASAGSKKAPQIGDNVYIAPGCKIFGDIVLADNITISANSVVNKTELTPNVLIGGIPAKVLKTLDGDQQFNWKS